MAISPKPEVDRGRDYTVGKDEMFNKMKATVVE